VAENPRAAATLGWSSELITTFSWILGGALGALAGILIAPIAQLQVDGLTFLVVPALAVALLARFESFIITLLAGLALGILQSEMGQYVHVDGLADALPFLIIVAVLFVGGQTLPVRGFVGERIAQFGTGRVRPALVIPVIALTVLFVQLVAGEELVLALTQSLAFGIVFLSIVVLTGYAGQLSLGQMALAGIGALIAGKLVSTTGVSFLPAVIIAVVGTAVVSILFAIPALRTRGATLAVVTLGLGVSVVSLVFNSTKYSGGADGINVSGQKILGIQLDPLFHPKAYAMFVLVCFVLSALVVTNIRRGPIGRSLIGIRANERAAAALGVSVTGTKIYAFAVSAGIAALGGVAIGFQQYSIIFSDTFATFQSILVIAYSVLGGVGYVAGTLLAAIFPGGGVGSWLTDQLGGGVTKWLPMIGGVGLLLTLVQNPNGMANTFDHMGSQLRKRLVRRRGRVRAPEPLQEVERRPVAPATLRVSDLSVHFGATRAVRNVSLTVKPGQVVGLIGPNGAGKTTLIDAVTGYVRTASGSVLVNERPLDKLRVHKRARAGVSRSFQSLELFEDVTIRENLLVASDRRGVSAYLTSLLPSRRRPLPAAAVTAVREFGLVEDLDRLPTELSYGRRRLVAVARAVASSPSILLLDEPAAGLSGQEADELAQLVRWLADELGIAVLLVEHNMSFVMRICDEIVVLDFGARIATGTPSEISSDPVVIGAYLGADEEEEAELIEQASAARAAGDTEAGGRVIR
jgi:ABC-type branched-subunit amino acid transport system ATPase component/ABC-type branched-subunit amino acid transport system permease subunit